MTIIIVIKTLLSPCLYAEVFNSFERVSIFFNHLLSANFEWTKRSGLIDKKITKHQYLISR